MTSTSFNVGLNGDGSRSSSRVLRPPGGGHTDIFGGEPEAPRGRRPAPSAAANMHAQSEDSIKFSNGSDAPPQNGQTTPVTPEQVDAPASVPEPKQDMPKNIPEAAKGDAPKRVRVPPGGFSSGLW